MKNHGGQMSSDWPNSMQYFRIAVVGAGAAAPVAPAGTTYSLTATPDFKKQGNALSRSAAEIPTRSGVGAYVITYDADFQVARILNAPVEVYGQAGVWASITSINVATRQITLTVLAAAGTAVDLASTGLLVISIEAQDSAA